jgi:HK97 family phage major capsid protein
MPPTIAVPPEEEYRKAVSALHEAADAVDAAAKALSEAEEGADLDSLNASLTEAEEAFSAAETLANDSKETLDRRAEFAKRTAEARAIAIPDAPEPEPEVEATAADRAPVGEPARPKGAKAELTYRPNGGRSFFRDLYNRDIRQDSGAAERLARHMTEMEAEGRFDLSSTDEAGGYLVAPLYLQDEFIDRATAGRVIADAIGIKNLPPNTDSVNIPKLNTGTDVANQADNEAVKEQDATFGTIAADVKTKAGLQDVSQQLIDRSVPGVDGIIYADLTKQYAVRLDQDVINSSTSNNKGLLQVSEVNAVTYTDGSPTLSELYPKIAQGIANIHEGVFMPADAIFMHPRRWAFCLAAQDSQNRPLITSYAPANAAGVTDGVIATGPVGAIQGIPVWVDPNIPTNLGSGTNEDRVIIVRRDELYLYEDPNGPYLETFRDVGSGNMTVRFRLHNYWAQLHARRPKAITVISGTGLATPSF